MTKLRGRQQSILVSCRFFVPATASRQNLTLTQRPIPR